MLSSLNNIGLVFITFFFGDSLASTRATSGLPNRFLPFPHGSHVLRVPGPGAHPWPGAAGSLYPAPGARAGRHCGRGGGGGIPACQSQRPMHRSRRRRLHTYCTGSARRERERAAREGARREAGRSGGLRLRTGVVFHKAVLKVSWQLPAARLCKETTETRSVEQRLLCCPDFLRISMNYL